MSGISNKMNVILQGRERQRIFREKNRDRLNEKKRQIYASWKQVMADAAPRPEPVREPSPPPPARPATPEPEPEPVPAQTPLLPVVKRKRVKASKGPDFETTVERLRERYSKENSFKLNVRELETLYELTGTSKKKAIATLNDYQYMDRLIKNRRTKEGNTYGGNTLKLTYSLLVVICDPKNGFYTNITQEARDFYDNEKNVLNALSRQATSERNKTLVLPMTFNQLLAKAKEANDHDKFTTYLSLHKYTMTRDNFKELLVIDDEAKAQKTDVNYLVIPRAENKAGLFILNAYKTVEKYGTDRIIIPADVVDTVKAYGIKYNNYLFGAQSNSNFISGKLIQFGIKEHTKDRNGAINLLRRMVLLEHVQLTGKETDNDEEAIRQQILTAKKMKHTRETQQTTYLLHQKPAVQDPVFRIDGHISSIIRTRPR